MTRPRCSVLTGAFDFSGCGDCTSCPPAKPVAMNRHPSAIVFHGIACIGGLYIRFVSNRDNSSGFHQPRGTAEPRAPQKIGAQGCTLLGWNVDIVESIRRQSVRAACSAGENANARLGETASRHGVLMPPKAVSRWMPDDADATTVFFVIELPADAT